MGADEIDRIFPEDGVTRSDVEAVVRDTLHLAAIPAPTFEEGARGDEVARLLSAEGLAVERDKVGNVIASLPGDAAGPAVAILAHLDTVFAAGTPLDVRREGDRLVGPGVGDNALALGALLWLARRLQGRPLERRVLLVADVGEEGLGDLRGARAFADEYGREVAAAIALEGHGTGRIVHLGVGSRRFAITVRAPGGHSWSSFGSPSAVHVLLRLGASLADLPLPTQPKTTLNIGVIEGGRSVNTIADSARMLVDTRSLSEEHLGEMERRIRAAARVDLDGVTVEVERVGNRPAVSLPPHDPLVRLAASEAERAGLRPSREASSTDANALLAAGIPAVCLGISSGGNTHRTDEWIAVEPIGRGLASILGTVLRLAGSS